MISFIKSRRHSADGNTPKSPSSSQNNISDRSPTNYHVRTNSGVSSGETNRSLPIQNSSPVLDSYVLTASSPPHLHNQSSTTSNSSIYNHNSMAASITSSPVHMAIDNGTSYHADRNSNSSGNSANNDNAISEDSGGDNDSDGDNNSSFIKTLQFKNLGKPPKTNFFHRFAKRTSLKSPLSPGRLSRTNVTESVITTNPAPAVTTTNINSQVIPSALTNTSNNELNPPYTPLKSGISQTISPFTSPKMNVNNDILPSIQGTISHEWGAPRKSSPIILSNKQSSDGTTSNSTGVSDTKHATNTYMFGEEKLPMMEYDVNNDEEFGNLKKIYHSSDSTDNGTKVNYNNNNKIYTYEYDDNDNTEILKSPLAQRLTNNNRLKHLKQNNRAVRILSQDDLVKLSSEYNPKLLNELLSQNKHIITPISKSSKSPVSSPNKDDIMEIVDSIPGTNIKVDIVPGAKDTTSLEDQKLNLNVKQVEFKTPISDGRNSMNANNNDSEFAKFDDDSDGKAASLTSEADNDNRSRSSSSGSTTSSKFSFEFNKTYGRKSSVRYYAKETADEKDLQDGAQNIYIDDIYEDEDFDEDMNFFDEEDAEDDDHLYNITNRSNDKNANYKSRKTTGYNDISFLSDEDEIPESNKESDRHSKNLINNSKYSDIDDISSVESYESVRKTDLSSIHDLTITDSYLENTVMKNKPVVVKSGVKSYNDLFALSDDDNFSEEEEGDVEFNATKILDTKKVSNNAESEGEGEKSVRSLNEITDSENLKVGIEEVGKNKFNAVANISSNLRKVTNFNDLLDIRSDVEFSEFSDVEQGSICHSSPILPRKSSKIVSKDDLPISLTIKKTAKVNTAQEKNDVVEKSVGKNKSKDTKVKKYKDLFNLSDDEVEQDDDGGGGGGDDECDDYDSDGDAITNYMHNKSYLGINTLQSKRSSCELSDKELDALPPITMASGNSYPLNTPITPRATSPLCNKYGMLSNTCSMNNSVNNAADNNNNNNNLRTLPSHSFNKTFGTTLDASTSTIPPLNSGLGLVQLPSSPSANLPPNTILKYHDINCNLDSEISKSMGDLFFIDEENEDANSDEELHISSGEDTDLLADANIIGTDNVKKRSDKVFLKNNLTRKDDNDNDNDDEFLDEINNVPEDFNFSDDEMKIGSDGKFLNNKRKDSFKTTHSYSEKPLNVARNNKTMSNKVELKNKTVTFFYNSHSDSLSYLPSNPTPIDSTSINDNNSTQLLAPVLQKSLCEPNTSKNLSTKDSQASPNKDYYKNLRTPSVFSEASSLSPIQEGYSSVEASPRK
ncbi:Zrg8p SCDLUD_002312 [Saccharomycodes ludwigii]|uniref:Zrg8p n=1 Tax=Saccharomycodes ludwigii TaxID=36035 RepID=UPI001E84E25E|nr:hypothetical protein SCDLUD_002312 [Saccharomycodes ludwigii]KAH3900857.1 hypothetical protein SCDLUD_002312 [Saccharomycodes ludwigii]